MQSFFLVIHILAALTLIGLVLLQQGRGADAGAAFGSGASGTLFGSRGPTTFLTRITAVLAATFFLTSMSLAYLSGQTVERKSVVERVETPIEAEEPAPLELPVPDEETGHAPMDDAGFEAPAIPDVEPPALGAPGDEPSEGDPQ